MNTGTRGDAALLLASSKLVESGLILLKPISECLKFDLVVYDSIGFHKLQIKRAYKSSSEKKYKISLRRVSMTRQGAIAKSYTKEDTDFIIGVIMETGDLYCLPIELVAARNSITLNPYGVISKYISNKKSTDTEPYKNLITLHNTIYKL